MNILLPSMTTQMVLSVFEYLVNMEIRKHHAGALEFRTGCQEGIIASITMMFGSASDDMAEIGYEKGVTWLQLTQQIAEEKLIDWIQVFEQNEECDPDEMDIAIKKAVQGFAIENPTLLSDALKVYL